MPVKTKRTLHFADLPRDYAGLVALLPPRPLHDATDADNVEEIVFAMAGHQLSRDQEDYLDLMSDLLERYFDDRDQPDPPLSVAERLTYLMEESGLTPDDLRRLLGVSQPMVSLLMNGKRELSKAHIVRLAEHFRLAADYFMP